MFGAKSHAVGRYSEIGVHYVLVEVLRDDPLFARGENLAQRTAVRFAVRFPYRRGLDLVLHNVAPEII